MKHPSVRTIGRAQATHHEIELLGQLQGHQAERGIVSTELRVGMHSTERKRGVCKARKPHAARHPESIAHHRPVRYHMRKVSAVA